MKSESIRNETFHLELINISKFANFPDVAKDQLNMSITNIIDRIFVQTSENDYILARFCYFNGLTNHFFWNALQCIEKILKALILHGNQSVKKYSHEIKDMWLEKEKFDDSFKSFNFIFPEDSQELKSTIGWQTNDVLAFFEHLEKYGNANTRYDYYGVDSSPEDLFKLDQLYFFLHNKLTNRALTWSSKFPHEQYIYKFNYSFPHASAVREDFSVQLNYNITNSQIQTEINLCLNKDALKHWLKENIRIKDSDMK